VDDVDDLVDVLVGGGLLLGNLLSSEREDGGRRAGPSGGLPTPPRAFHILADEPNGRPKTA